MTEFMDEPVQIKFETNSQLRDAAYAIFHDQGLNLKTGMERLLRFVVNSPKHLRPLIFQQADGSVARALAKHVIEEERSVSRGQRSLTTGGEPFADEEPRKLYADLKSEAASPERKRDKKVPKQ